MVQVDHVQSYCAYFVVLDAPSAEHFYLLLDVFCYLIVVDLLAKLLFYFRKDWFIEFLVLCFLV